MEDQKILTQSVSSIPFLIFLLVTVFFMSLHRAPSAAIVTDCFIRPQRTRANAVLNLMAGMAGELQEQISRLNCKNRYFVIQWI